MSVVDRRGEQIKIHVPKKPSEIETEKARDLALIRLRSQGQTWQSIGRFLNIHHTTAMRRWRSIPEPVREYYRRTSMG